MANIKSMDIQAIHCIVILDFLVFNKIMATTANCIMLEVDG